MAYQPSCEELPKIPESTIVEIKMAYQPVDFAFDLWSSTIVEIKMAYQPRGC